MKSFSLGIGLLYMIFSSCGTGSKKSLNASFQAYEERFLTELWKVYPEWATMVGYHSYDSVLTIPNEGSRALQLSFVRAQLDSLGQFDVAKLDAELQIDYHLIENFLRSEIWAIEEEKEFTWNPASYNVTGLIAVMLSENYAPLEKRLGDIYHRMLKIPFYYEAARAELYHPVVVLTDLAISQHKGGISTFEVDLVDSIKQSNLDELEKKEMTEALHRSVAAIKRYVAFLEGFRHHQPRSFRLGEALYEAKFNFHIQSEHSAREIYEFALGRKDELHREMYKISQSLWATYFGSEPQPADSFKLVKRVIEKISLKHVKPEAFQEAIEAQIPELIRFVKQKDLVSIDESKPLVVRREPAYMAGIAGASISAPGPYDKGGNTYYNVGSLEGWPAEKAESYLREYNHYVLQILNIHEAIPGHYTQLVHANENPSIVKSIFANGAMIEGWAVYTEQMMLENGYGNNEPEMWLMWYKWHLRTVCNAILDYAVHVKGMSEEEAMHLLIDEAFQELAEAQGKWRRVSVTSVQLMSYYTGYKEIIDLRSKVQEDRGGDFQLKPFHEQFLSYGNAPVKYIRKLMLGE